MNHLILRTHTGSNIDLIKNYLKLNSEFNHFIYENDPVSFINQYKKDKQDGLITNEIKDIDNIKENWNVFFRNIVENVENIYGSKMNNRWFVYISTSYTQKIINKKNIKTVWVLRNPIMSWAHKEDPIDPKRLSYNIKMLNDEYIHKMLSWVKSSIKNYTNDLMTPYLKNIFSRFDIENSITFSILFVLMCTNPSSFSLNGNKIKQNEWSNITNSLLNILASSDFISILNNKNTVFPTLENFKYTKDEDIFNDNNILTKFGDFSNLLTAVYYTVNVSNRQAYIKLIQNFIYIIKKLNSCFDFSNKDFLNQNINKETLKKIDIKSVNIIFKVLNKINLDDVLYPTDDGNQKLKNPRDNPLDINKLINKRPNSPEVSDDYNTAYNLSYNDQITKVNISISSIGFTAGYNKNSKNLELNKFSEGYYAGFQAGFNDGSNTVAKKQVWNKKVITYTDGYSLGYDVGYDGGNLYRNTETSNGKHSINLYYNGLRDGFYDSSLDINQKLYNYNYDCGFYDKRVEELESGIGNSITNSVSNYIKNILTIQPIDKLIFYEDIIHPYRVQSWNSVFRFFYFYYFSTYDFIQKPDLNTIKFNDVIEQSLALLDLKIFIGQQTLSSNVTFKRKNNFLSYDEWFFTYSWPFTTWTQGWEWYSYNYEEWNDLLNIKNDYNFDNNNILNLYRYLNNSLNFGYKQWLYNNCKTPYDYNTYIRK